MSDTTVNTSQTYNPPFAVKNDDNLYVVDGGIADRVNVLSGGAEYVSSGGAAIHTTIYSGGGQLIQEDGYASGTVIDGGFQNLVNTGSGGYQVQAQDTTIVSGGRQVISEGGAASGTTIGVGGQQDVGGGVARLTHISGGFQYVYGQAYDTDITGSNGFIGEQLVLSNGVAVNITVNSDGYLLAESGSFVSGLTINAGAAEFQDGAKYFKTEFDFSAPTIVFGDGAGSLIIDDPQEDDEGGDYIFQASLTTFGPGDNIDLANFAYDSGARAVISGSNLDLVENGAVVAEFELINPGATSFTVSLDGSGLGTLITADTPTSGGTAPSPPSNSGTNPPSNNSTGLSVAFNPGIGVAPGDVVTLSGTYAGGAGVPSILISEDGSALGVATVNPNGTWSLTVDYTALPGPHANIIATATDATGQQASGKSPYNLVTDYSHVKPDGYPYRTVQDNFDPVTGAYTGSIFFNRNGTEYYESTYQNTPDGGSTYTYSGGTYFKKKGFSSFSDSYNVQNIDIYNTDGELTSHAEDNNDGTRTVYVSGHRATVSAAAAPTHFVFDPGLGRVTIDDFSATGRGHDSIETDSVSASRLAAVLLTQPDAGGNLTLHLGHGNVVTLVGVDHVTKRDFTHVA